MGGVGKTRAALFSCALLAACAALAAWAMWLRADERARVRERASPSRASVREGSGDADERPGRGRAVARWHARLEDLADPAVPDAENAYVPLAEARRWCERNDEFLRRVDFLENREGWDGPPVSDRQYAEALDALAPCFDLLDEALTRAKWAAPPVDWSRGPNAWMEGVAVVAKAKAVLGRRFRHTAGTPGVIESTLAYEALWDRIELPMILGWQVDSTRILPGIIRDRHEWADFDAGATLRVASERLLSLQPERGPPPRVFEEEGALVTWVIERLEAGEPVGWRDAIGDGETLVNPAAAGDFRAVRRLMRDARDSSGVTPGEAARIAATWETRVPPLENPIAKNWAEYAGRVFRIYASATARARLVYVYLHLRVFRDAHGHWPPTLPRGMPLDPFTGRPFAYDGEHLYARRPGEPGPGEDGFRYLVENGLGWNLE